MGEGMIRISRDWRRSGHNRKGPKVIWYRQIVRITLRQDDEKVLDWIQDNIGGHIFRRGIRNKIKNKMTGVDSFSRPVTIWQAEDIETCAKVCKILIECPIPSRKKNEASAFLEFASLKKLHYKRGIGYPKEIISKFEFYYQKLKELKRFKE